MIPMMARPIHRILSGITFNCYNISLHYVKRCSPDYVKLLRTSNVHSLCGQNTGAETSKYRWAYTQMASVALTYYCKRVSLYTKPFYSEPIIVANYVRKMLVKRFACLDGWSITEEISSSL